jgi:hypothetical protein
MNKADELAAKIYYNRAPHPAPATDTLILAKRVLDLLMRSGESMAEVCQVYPDHKPDPDGGEVLRWARQRWMTGGAPLVSGAIWIQGPKFKPAPSPAIIARSEELKNGHI